MFIILILIKQELSEYEDITTFISQIKLKLVNNMDLIYK